MIYRSLIICAAFAVSGCGGAVPDPAAHITKPPRRATKMNNDHIDKLVRRIDSEVRREAPNVWLLRVESVEVTIITDERADRMRIMAPVAEATKLPPELLMRMLQANFDSVLDARYAVAHGRVWSAFIHPLGSLTERDFLSGLAQTVNGVLTFGTSFSSGALIFGGGDSGEIHRKLHDRILEKGEKI